MLVLHYETKAVTYCFQQTAHITEASAPALKTALGDRRVSQCGQHIHLMLLNVTYLLGNLKNEGKNEDESKEHIWKHYKNYSLRISFHPI
jgi:hypothetical protein